MNTDYSEKWLAPFLNSTVEERRKMCDNLVALYEGARQDCDTCWQISSTTRSTSARNNYREAVQRLGAIEDVLTALGLDLDVIRG